MSIAREITLQLTGAPRTKKTSNRVVRHGRFTKVLPSAAFEKWNALVQPQLAKIRATALFRLPLIGPVNVAALFYRHANVGDLAGYMQSLADALQEGGILENDSQIVSWDGTRALKDAKDPGIRVTITSIAP